MSVGQTSYPEDGLDAEQLLAEADRRMYVLKQQHYEQAGGRARAASAPGSR